MSKKLTVSEIRYLNNHFGNGYFFSRKIMNFCGDTVKHFGTYLNKDGDTILFHKIRGTTWKFNPTTNSLDSYKEGVK